MSLVEARIVVAYRFEVAVAAVCDSTVSSVVCIVHCVHAC
eukprot:COSAG01_NODE_74954_length_199_cov_73.280000_1_plen_39_part_01